MYYFLVARGLRRGVLAGALAGDLPPEAGALGDIEAGRLGSLPLCCDEIIAVFCFQTLQQYLKTWACSIHLEHSCPTQ